MPQTRLIIVLHCHQPVGNFDTVFEQTTSQCYGPLVELLGRTPSARVGLHFTGPLLEWFEVRRPDLIAQMRLLAERGQIEVLGGGMYEPMLAVLPERDALGQLRMMSDECERLLGQRPRGMWLAERVWEPDLARLLSLAGMRYTLLDDSHFRAAGLVGRLTGYYVTEKAGAPVAIFPIDQQMRYSIPYREVPSLLEELRSLGGTAVTYGDDGEKFGVWPGSYKLVWEKGWLAELFARLEDCRDDIRLCLPSEEIASQPPAGRVYLPATSYEEMGEWALSADSSARYHDTRERAKALGNFDELRPFMRGGIWQNFFVKYDEANRLHKKMIRVSRKIAALPAPDPAAVRALYRAQCNCGYWHGLFGGLYLSHLRHALYSNLLEAEVLAEPRAASRAEINDHDGDMQPEIMLETPSLDVYVKPDAGGSVFEIDYKPRRFCLTNVLGRRWEAYHRDIARAQVVKDEDNAHSIHDLIRTKELGLEALVRQDAYVRRTFIDHLLPRAASLESIDTADYGPIIDLPHASYEVVEASEDRDAAWALLRYQGQGLRVRKAVRVSSAEGLVEVAYDVARVEGAPLACTFAVETAWSLLGGDDPERFYDVPGQKLSDLDHQTRSRGEWRSVGEVRVLDRRTGFRLVFVPSPEADAWRFPLETVSQSEEGFERNYQGTVLAFAWRTELAIDAAPLRVKLVLRVDPL